MTLTERVQRAGNAVADIPQTDADIMDELRERLQDVVSVDELAALAQANPEQARNEVRSACRRVFDDPAWPYSDRELERRLVAQLLDMIFGFGLLEDFPLDL